MTPISHGSDGVDKVKVIIVRYYFGPSVEPKSSKHGSSSVRATESSSRDIGRDCDCALWANNHRIK